MTAISALRTVAALLLIAAATALVGPIVIAVGWLFRWPNLPFQAGLLTVRLALAIVGVRYVVEGQEYILDRPAVYCVNHTSNVEPPLLFVALRRLAPKLAILYKAELRKLPILNVGFDLVGFIPVDRGNREQTTRALDTAVARLNAGASFLVFPEGTRSRTGELLPFRKGAFVMAMRAGAPLVPMAITGARDAMRKGSSIIRPVTVRLRLGPPIETRGLGDDRRDALVHSVRSEVERLLAAPADQSFA
jgi:1-acyl-sn-glycerol-3-phosphate acyltransferase